MPATHELFGVRRQIEVATALGIAATTIADISLTITDTAKAVSRFACHRTPKGKVIGYNCRMAEFLDVTTWARRELFEFYRRFDKPYFNICTTVDVTKLLEFLRSSPEVSVTLTYHYFALRTANEIEQFRYRLREGRVLIHDVIHGGTTVMQPNENFTFAYFNYDRDFAKFIREAQRSVDEMKKGDGPLSPREGDDAIHFTTLPWVSFTSFAHARNWEPEDSVPKIAFGKFVKETDRVRLPISVEVHHALVDGVHVGRFLEGLEESLANPEEYLR